MNNNLFRKSAIERISAPEQLCDYIKVVPPSVWLILVGVIVAMGGVFAFVATTDVPLMQLFFGH